ncbi:pilin [bacterium]|nr:pilin [bacterium]
MKKNKIIASILTALILVIGFTNKAMAEALINNPLNSSDVPSLICIIFDALISIGAPVATLFIVLAGVKWITSMGNASKINEAKSSLTFAVIGLIVVLSSKEIYSLVAEAIGGSGAACK